ncbi:MAG TPA: hypothetical protein PLR91_10570, partial [Kiritimatiellia bacterium]|nr:hypothetical protein [Kiritimatiellia bacterium]
MKRRFGSVVAGMCAAGCVMAASPFEGAWCLTSPSGGAVWMRVEMNQGVPSAKAMWEIGGVEPFKRVALEDGVLVMERPHDHWYMTKKGMRRDILGTDTLRATVQGDAMTVELAR